MATKKFTIPISTNLEPVYQTPPETPATSSKKPEKAPFINPSFPNDTTDEDEKSPPSVQKKIFKKKLKSKSQIQILQEHYRVNKNPGQPKIEEISKQIELSYYQVYKWFWEKRRAENTEKLRVSETTEVDLAERELRNKFFICTQINLPISDPFSKLAAEVLR